MQGFAFDFAFDFAFPFGQRTLFPRRRRFSIAFPFGQRTLFPFGQRTLFPFGQRFSIEVRLTWALTNDKPILENGKIVFDLLKIFPMFGISFGDVFGLSKNNYL